jgi:hypothetical protein
MTMMTDNILQSGRLCIISIATSNCNNHDTVIVCMWAVVHCTLGVGVEGTAQLTLNWLIDADHIISLVPWRKIVLVRV